MDAEQLLIKYQHLLVSNDLKDLLEAKDRLMEEKQGLAPKDRERIGDELACLQESIEIAMNMDYSRIPKTEDDDVPTLHNGVWKNVDRE